MIVIAKMDPDAFRLFFALFFFLWTQTVSEATKDIAESEDRAVCSISSAKTNTPTHPQTLPHTSSVTSAEVRNVKVPCESIEFPDYI